MTDFDLLSILNGMLKFEIKDEAILKGVEKMIKDEKINKVNTLTNILYVFAKMEFKVD